jgi:hypothetical protein
MPAIIIDRSGIHLGLRAALLLLLSCLWAEAARAHGGVSLEDDLCVLSLGSYRMHFTGYQPETSGAEEFCEDIPETGTAVIVLDAIDDALRSIPLEVRILKDTRDLGNDAKFEELGDAAAIEAATVARLESAVHATGSSTLQYAFPEAGRFIGLVRAQPAVGGEVVAVFPFAVGGGSSQWWIYGVVILVALLAATALFAWASRGRESAT